MVTIKNGGSCENYLGDQERGLRLSENEFSEQRVTRQDVYVIAEDVDTRLVDIWFQDSIGSRYEVKGSKASIDQLLGAWGDIA